MSVQLGDGLNERLPMIAQFDHVISKAVIGGKTFWLDGTRTGDVRLADIEVPRFRFALPLRTPGAALEPLVIPPPARPLTEYSFQVDMTDGATLPIKFHVEEITRGDDAFTTHLQMESMTAAVRQQALRDYFAGQYNDVEPKTYSASWDPVTREGKFVMDGLEKHDWQWSYEADNSGVGWKADFDRSGAFRPDAPFAVANPYYTVTHVTIRLPNGGKGFASATSDVDRTVAGIAYHRKAKLDGAVFTVETTQRGVVQEFAAKDAPAAQQALRDLAKQQALLAWTPQYQPTAQETSAALALEPTTAGEFFRRANARVKSKDLKGALSDLTRATELAPDNGFLFIARGVLQAEMGLFDGALADLQKAVVLSPSVAEAHFSLAQLLSVRGRNNDALAEADKGLIIAPSNPGGLALRGEIHRLLGHYEQALADTGQALQKTPAALAIYRSRVNTYVRMRQPDKAVADARAAVTANPTNNDAYILLGATLVRLDRKAEAMAAFDKAIALQPSESGYLTRINARAESDIVGKRRDVAAALKIVPDSKDAYPVLADAEMSAKNYPEVIAAASAGLARAPNNVYLLLKRAIASQLSGKTKDADRDFAAVRSGKEDRAMLLNNICWEKATHDVALETALEDCDASLKETPGGANTFDSRGFVLYRLGRYQDAIAAYDKAIAVRPEGAASLYVRGLAKRRLGRTADGDADVAKAKAMSDTVTREFTRYGVVE